MMTFEHIGLGVAVAGALALAACGKPAAVQPERQIAGQDPATTAAAPAADAAAPAADAGAPAADAGAAPGQVDADGFPMVPSVEEVAAAAAAAGMPVTSETRTRLVCDNEEKLVVRFFPEQGIAVLVRGGQNTELNQEPAASGIRYSNGTTTITGKGDDYTVQIGMMAPMQCKAA